MARCGIFALVTVVATCLSVVLIQEVTVLHTKLTGIRRQLQTPTVHRSLREVSHRLFMSTKWEPSFRLPRNKRAQDVWTTQASFLQMTAVANEKPIQRGNVTTIPWTVAIQQGLAATASDNKIIIHQDSYFMVFGQVLFYNQGTIMGHLIRQRLFSASGTETGHQDLLRCLQEMPQENGANTCFTAGILKLARNAHLELVIPDRPHVQVAMDTESTFFGIIQL